MTRFILLGGLLGILFASCGPEAEVPYQAFLEEGEEFGGGATTILDESVNAFGQAAPNLTGDKDLLFVTGNAFFKRNWVTAPASTEDLDGLGPYFNARSCSACHALDGRAAPPLTPDEEPLGLLFRLSKPSGGEDLPDDNYGFQIQPHGILAVEGEGFVSVSYREQPGIYPDGTTYSLRNPIYDFSKLNYGSLEPETQVSPRIGPQMIGLGLLEAIAEETLLGFADPEDANGDGISGRANYVMNVETGMMQIGRFGWKANQPTVRQQVAGAFNGDIGITSSLFPDQPCAPNQDCSEIAHGGDPELTEDILDRVSLYSEVLAVPRRRDWEEPEVLKGKGLFESVGCVSCHIPKIVTGNYDVHPEFSNETIRPYTDLLLHDMGSGLADNRPDGLADGQEWKTPPLWGLGLIHVVSGHTYLLHDGRARNIEEAILWHGGEAKTSQQNFKDLDKSGRSALIKFIESL
ncbi:di-heme oxidoredictase family protein [Reichenbachiella sp. MSK19-1]|uniref:di-heme oxidoreductase family protein n=1 Tax=Reichenbachiella sp. MSK19-1 TaxID=1897631 RepID=UPI000E6CFE47|nr:di-heme oxidoredictase family protein [Reichenbachiella sp. MSK19-1]RJE70387.1 thiol oxidoreductase [Reichenbachiella sp. MSK19-1]